MTSLHAQLATDLLSQRVLRGLYDLAQADVPAETGALARMLGLRPSEVASGLLRLDDLGLVCAERARLTLRGLAIAVRLPPLNVGVLARAQQAATAARAGGALGGACVSRLPALPSGPLPRMGHPRSARENHAGSGRISGVASSGVARRAANR